MRIQTLKLSNFSNGDENQQLTVVDASKFKIRIPEFYRKKPCSIRVVSAIVNRFDQIGGISLSVNNPDPQPVPPKSRYMNRSVFIRHNIGNNSYDSSNSGSSNLIGPIIFNNPNTAGIATLLQNTESISLGLSTLPQELIFERVRFSTSTKIEPLIGDTAGEEDNIALIHITLELTYED